MVDKPCPAARLREPSRRLARLVDLALEDLAHASAQYAHSLAEAFGVVHFGAKIAAMVLAASPLTSNGTNTKLGALLGV